MSATNSSTLPSAAAASRTHAPLTRLFLHASSRARTQIRMSTAAILAGIDRDAMSTAFLVHFTSDAAIELERGLEFHVHGAAVRVQPWPPWQPSPPPAKHGLLLSVAISAEDHQHAFTKARPLAEVVLTLIATSVSAVAKPCQPLIAIDFDGSKPDREMVQHLPLPMELRPGRRLDVKVLKKFFEAFDAARPEDHDRIARAMRWYRKGLLELDPFDRFMNWWLGLETLNPRLQSKHVLSAENVIRKCKACGADVVIVPSLSGVRHLITRLCNRPDSEWGRLIAARNGLTHGNANLAQLNAEVNQLLPVIQVALMTGLLDLVGLRGSDLEGRLVRAPLHETPGPELKIHVVLHDCPAEEIELGRIFPQYKVTPTSTELSRVDLSRSESVTANINLFGFNGKVTRLDWELIATADPEDTKAKIEALPGPRRDHL
jgi:hypothetical protein